MPIDLAIIKKLDKVSAGQSNIIGTGNTNYIWESYENDIQFDTLNQFMTISGTTKLAQGIMKIILTRKGDNIEDPDYGTLINTMIGTKFTSDVFAEVQSEIIDALIHYNLINSDNPDSDEVIQIIDEIKVVQDLNEPRAMKIRVAITTESGKSIGVEVPQLT